MKIKNENGLTLVELLSVIIIGGVIMIFATSLIVQAMKNQERITIESNLRDEADIIMAQLTKAIFTLKESDIVSVECGVLLNGVKELVSCKTESTTLSVEDASSIAEAKDKMESCAKMNSPQNPTKCLPFALISMKIIGPNNVTKISKIGFEGNTVYFKDGDDGKYEITNDKVSLLPYYTIDQQIEMYAPNGTTALIGDRVSMKISFTLKHKLKNSTRTFQNEVLTVDDI